MPVAAVALTLDVSMILADIKAGDDAVPATDNDAPEFIKREPEDVPTTPALL